MIAIFFDNQISVKELEKELDHKEIYDTLNIYLLIRIYVENINIKIRSIFMEEVSQEKSIFDEYDKENGYGDEELEGFNIYDSYLNILNNLIEFAIEKCKNSLKECLDTEIIDLLDYIKFKIDKEENQEDYTNV